MRRFTLIGFPILTLIEIITTWLVDMPIMAKVNVTVWVIISLIWFGCASLYEKRHTELVQTIKYLQGLLNRSALK